MLMTDISMFEAAKAVKVPLSSRQKELNTKIKNT